LPAPEADPVPESLAELVERLPTEPGVYLMKDKRGKVIYVGKAQNLRHRVRSYFTRSSSDSRPFVALLGRLLGDIETIVVGSEKEALLLENNLIKQHRPRFNVKLVDDKNFLVLRLAEQADYPRLEVVRRIKDDGARYFGPYHSATSCRQTLDVVNRHFKLRTCTDQVMRSRRRPCLQYQIKRCDAPCVFPVPKEQYAEQVRDVGLFLEGKDRELTERLRERMLQASESMEFEVAAALRDQLQAITRTLEEQRVVSERFVDQDVFGLYREGDVLTIAILHIRQGKLLGRRAYHFTGQEFPDEESMSAFLGLYYDLGNVIPDEVLLPVAIEDEQAKQEWLRELSQGAAPGRAKQIGRLRRRVEILVPKRGPRRKLVELASKNAQAAFASRRDKRRDAEDALEKLSRRLGLKRPPRRIECFDVSHMQGTYPVASMVVFVDGEPARSEYRTFKVRTVTNDDFAALYEVLSRRFRRAKQLLDSAGSPPSPEGRRDGGEGEDIDDDAERPASGWALPDLMVIDGGKGQLGTALAALKDAGLDLSHLDLVALAKEREDESGEKQPDRVFLPRVKDPMKLRPNSAELYVLSRIRDEAHRFAVTFHQKQRQKGTIRSQLADIPGVGRKRQQALLRALGSVKRIRAATLEELCAVPGMNRAAAEAVLRYFGGPPAAPAPAADPPDPDVAENAAEGELSDLQEEEEEAPEEDIADLVAQASERGK
jgi:excinuclease ABC subunit C